MNAHFVCPEHTVPADAVLLTLKFCECCGFMFARANADKVCRSCHASPAQPPVSRRAAIEILEELMRGEEPLPQ